MDIDFPYAEDGARLRLLYRLPIPSTARDLLVFGAPEVTRELIEGWAGPAHVVETWSGAGLPAQSADVVALAGVAASASHGPASRTLLSGVFAALRPGGWAVGHIEQACTLRGLLGGRGWRAALQARRYLGRPEGCLSALRAAGFVSAAAWYVHPSIEAPMGLIPVDALAARAEFMRSARAGRGHHSWVGFLSRLALARMGLGGLQQAQLFFWAQRPC